MQSQPSLLSRAETAADVDISVIKIVSFIAAVVVSAAVAGYFIAKVSIIASLISLSFFWILFGLQVLFIKGWRRIVVAVCLESAAMLVPTVILFKDNLSWYMLLALAALIAMLLDAENSGRREVNNSMKVPFFRTVKNALVKGIPAVLVFVTIIYTFVVGRGLVGENNQFFSEKVLTPMVQSFAPTFTSKTSIKDLLEDMFRYRFGEQFSSIPKEQLEKAYADSKNFVEGYTGGKIDISAPLGTAIYEFLSERLSKAEITTKLYIVFTLVTMAWFIIKTITFVIYIPLAFFAFILYETLIVTNFIVIQYETRSREIILLK